MLNETLRQIEDHLIEMSLESDYYWSYPRQTDAEVLRPMIRALKADLLENGLILAESREIASL